MADDEVRYEKIQTIELFGKEYVIDSNKNGYIKLKGSPMFIRAGVVYTPRGATPLSLAQTDKIRVRKVKVMDEDNRSPEQKQNEEIIEMFKEEV